MKAAFTCSYGLADRPQIMEMNFPHDTVTQAGSPAVSLRKLDLDILRVLAFTPVAARNARSRGGSRPVAVMALFGGTGRADHVQGGSFNPHFAVALDQLGAEEQHGETDVYHSASVNRKAARLSRTYAPDHFYKSGLLRT